MTCCRFQHSMLGRLCGSTYRGLSPRMPPVQTTEKPGGYGDAAKMPCGDVNGWAGPGPTERVPPISRYDKTPARNGHRGLLQRESLPDRVPSLDDLRPLQNSRAWGRKVLVVASGVTNGRSIWRQDIIWHPCAHSACTCDGGGGEGPLPEAKVRNVRPAVEDGFYYDFEPAPALVAGRSLRHRENMRNVTSGQSALCPEGDGQGEGACNSFACQPYKWS